jgi:arginine:pyruvate transaminase
MKYASISDRLDGLGAAKWAVHLAGRQRAHRGADLIFLSIGEPDLPPPPAVIERAITSLHEGRTKYTSGKGEPATLDAIAGHLSRRGGLPVTRDNVACTSGTQHALYAAITTLVEAGDEVLVPDPYYATYEAVVASSGARFVSVPTLPEEGFHLTPAALEAAVTPNSRVLLLNTPSNPTGAVLTAAEVDAIGEVCARHDLWIVCDEVYADLTFDVPFSSPFDRPQLRERSVSVASISKSHALPGFRSGWAAGPEEFIRRLTLVSETMLFGIQPFLCDAVVVALNEQHPEVARQREVFRERAQAMVATLAGSRAVSVHMPEGGMFVMADIRATGLSGEEFAWKLLDECGVVVMPGESFGSRGGGHLRLALTVEVDVMIEACRRIRELAEQLAAERGTPGHPG